MLLANTRKKGALAQNSLRWANFEDQSDSDWVQDIDRGEDGTGTKAKHIQSWNKDWEDFCKWIVDEYGPKYQTVKIDWSFGALWH